MPTREIRSDDVLLCGSAHWCSACGINVLKQLGFDPYVAVDQYDLPGYSEQAFWARDIYTDCPYHCSSDSRCLQHIELPYGELVGALIGRPTRHCYEYIIEQLVHLIDRAGYKAELPLYWARHFDTCRHAYHVPVLMSKSTGKLLELDVQCYVCSRHGRLLLDPSRLEWRT